MQIDLRWAAGCSARSPARCRTGRHRTGRYSHDRRLWCWAITRGDPVGKKFIRSFIKKGYEGPDEPFITGGVQPVGDTVVANKRYIFPLEKEYKDLLTTVSL